MSHEQLHSSAESNERATDLKVARAERLAELRETAQERAPEAQAEKRAEQARATIELQDHQEPEPAERAETEAAAPQRLRPLLDRHLNYTQTLASLQRQLKPVSRQFSRFIHAPAVEKTSEALESTVARPSVMVGAIWSALIVGSIFYFTARHYGYMLSGSELLYSFLVGGLLGVSLEGLWRLIRRRSSR